MHGNSNWGTKIIRRKISLHNQKNKNGTNGGCRSCSKTHIKFPVLHATYVSIDIVSLDGEYLML